MRPCQGRDGSSILPARTKKGSWIRKYSASCFLQRGGDGSAKPTSVFGGRCRVGPVSRQDREHLSFSHSEEKDLVICDVDYPCLNRPFLPSRRQKCSSNMFHAHNILIFYEETVHVPCFTSQNISTRCKQKRFTRKMSTKTFDFEGNTEYSACTLSW